MRSPARRVAQWLAFTLLSGCSSDPECPSIPRLPPEREGLVVTQASRWDEEGNDAPLLTDPHGGTLETVGDEVRIRYVEDGVEVLVVYDVVPNP